MSRYLGPKHKLCRREGVHLHLKGKSCERAKCSLSKKKLLNTKGKRKSFKTSNYLEDLREKQKIKRMYALQEKQFYNTFQKASKLPGKTSTNILILLEKRLDTILVRSHFASSQNQARQFITHGHILVNNKKVNIPSIFIKIGDIIQLKEKSTHMVIIRDNLKFFSKQKPPSWIDIDENKITCQLIQEPSLDEFKLPVNEQAIVEFYSKK